MQRVLTALASATLTLGVLSSAAFAQTGAQTGTQTEIPIDEAPADILTMAETTVPGVTFHRVSTEFEDGVVVYEFKAFSSAGKHVEVDITERGAIREIEMEIAFAQTPDRVKAALDKAASGFTPDYVEYSVRDGGRDYVYEFEGDYNGRILKVEIAENGRILFVSDGSIG